jgi:heat shock protein HtpX
VEAAAALRVLSYPQTGAAHGDNLSEMDSKRKQVWAHDSGLERRMAATLLLLGVVYAALLGALIAAGVSAVIVFSLAAAVIVFQLATSDRMALHAIGAREIGPDELPKLQDALSRVCIQADVRRPRLAVASSSVPNALAVGRSRDGATVCVTSRAIDLLDPPELEAVLAHEITHIQNRDAIVMTIASFFSLVAAFVVKYGWRFGHAFARIIVLVVAVGAWALSFVLLRALSRYRELAADRGAALVTGRPSALASALLKLDAEATKAPKKDLRAVEPLAALCIAGVPGRGVLARLVATHPTTARRVEALAKLEEKQQHA